MGIDINGYKLTNPDHLTFGASPTKVHAATYGVKVPTLPAMSGSATGGGTVYKVAPFPVNNATPNNGSFWNTSTYRFTAPVAGVYYVSYGGIVGDGQGVGTYGYFDIAVNGGVVTWGYHNCTQYWDLLHTEVGLKLQAGDYVQWFMNAPPGNNAGNSGAYQSNHNVVTIFLIG